MVEAYDGHRMIHPFALTLTLGVLARQDARLIVEPTVVKEVDRCADRPVLKLVEDELDDVVRLVVDVAHHFD